MSNFRPFPPAQPGKGVGKSAESQEHQSDPKSSVDPNTKPNVDPNSKPGADSKVQGKSLDDSKKPAAEEPKKPLEEPKKPADEAKKPDESK
jgi:hypothetical protein